LYPVQVYLFVKPDRIKGVAAGIYYHDPAAQRLVRLRSVEALPPGVFPPNVQPIYDGAAFALFLIGYLSAITPLYGEAARRFCYLEAGYMGQLLMSEAPRHNLGLCPVGHAGIEPIRPWFDLEETHLALHTLLGGDITDEQKADGLDDTPSVNYERVFEESLREFLARRLPAYMLPASYRLIDSLPLTRNGKIDYHSLPDTEPGAQPAAPPQTALERQVAALWQEVLGVDRVGLFDNFYEMGGHSVLLVKVQVRLQEMLGRELPLVDLFRYPTIRSLIDHLGADEDGQARPGVLSHRRESRSAGKTLAQQRRLQKQERRTGRGTGEESS
jgi:acyl carrier protein